MRSEMVLINVVPSVASLLQKIPDEIKPIAAMGLGALVLVGIVLFHGAGLHGILVTQKRWRRRLSAGPPRLTGAMLVFGWAVFLMLTLQLVEIVIWAFLLNHWGLIKSAHDAIYFCANAYTTLGMGKMELEEHWRFISPIMGISGLFTFAWTTSALVDVVSSHSELVEQLEDAKAVLKENRKKNVAKTPNPQAK